jgi:hypothetical protein
MMLRERINELKSSRKIIRLPQLPAELETEKTYQRIAMKFDQTGFVNTVDYRSLLQKLREVAISGAVRDLTYREMRLAASCLFEGSPNLADNKPFLEVYLDSLRSLHSRLTLKRLIYSYLLHFHPKNDAIRRIGEFLQDAVSRVNWDWRERAQLYRLFDPSQAPQQLASLAAESTSPRKELEKAGLSGQLLYGGLTAYVYLNSLNIIQRKLATEPSIEDVNRAIAWVQGDDGKLLFLAQRGHLANALLLPFAENDPNDEIQRRVQNFFLEQFGDPRIDQAPWISVEETAIDVMVRWIAQATLEQFLKVVDRVAARQQWDYRRSFWGAYIERRVVTNSWVAFGSSGAQVAKQLSKDATGKMSLRYAALEGAASDQAVLLLRIGDLVVADWSHNGRLRIWRRGNENAPEFHRPHYLAQNLRTNSDFDTVHLPPDGWQARAEAYIRKHTNIRLAEKDYMPRRRSR